MNDTMLLSWIENLGYAALFFALWLGIIGMPIPDEVIVMTGGAVTATGILHPIPAFILTYLGVVSGLSLGYVLGRLFGTTVLERLRRKKNMDKWISISEAMVQKYSSYALCISYFLPVIRHVMPYVIGLNNISFRRYALFSFTTGFVWTAIYFMVGRLVGDHVQEIGELVYRYGFWLLWIALGLIAVGVAARYTLQLQKRRRGDGA